MYKSLVNIVNTHIKKGELVEFFPIKKNMPLFRGWFVRAYRNFGVDNGPAMMELENVYDKRMTDKISWYSKFRILHGKTIIAEYKL